MEARHWNCDSCGHLPHVTPFYVEPNGTAHHPYCPLAPCGPPNGKDVVDRPPQQVEAMRAEIAPAFDGTYPPRLDDKGERVAGFKNPPPPGQGKGET